MASTAPGVLTANEVTVVTLAPGFGGLVVVNRSQSGEIWVTINGDEPEVAGEGSYCVLGARDFPLTRYRLQQGPVTVKLISSEALAFTVEAIG